MSDDDESKRRRAPWVLAAGVLLVVAVVAPVVVCAAFDVSFNGETGGVGVCMQGHPLRFPVTVLLVGVFFVVSSVVKLRGKGGLNVSPRRFRGS